MPPYWFGSMTLRTAGPTWADTTNSSANLEMAGVREIGRRCFKASSTGFCLGNGRVSMKAVAFALRSCHSELK